jgi:type IV pilus assembly protein PilB
MIKIKKRLGQILVDAGLISEEQLQDALAAQNGKSLARTLVDLHFISENKISAIIAEKLGLPFVDLGSYKIDPSAVSLVTDEIMRRYLALPVGFESDKLVVAMVDPANVLATDDLRIMTGFNIQPVVATESDILSAIEQYSRIDNTVEQAAISAAGGDSTGSETEALIELVEEAPIIKLVNLIITRAVNDRASDIHIEPRENDLRVRYRIDGVLHEIMTSPKQIQAGVISRLKIMAEMNIAERRIPQDGRCGLIVQGRAVDIRAASLPTVHGEKMVLRILEKGSILLGLDDLGFQADTLERYRESFFKPYGAILVTGPTGSGKSTTLYATLNVLNSPEKNIITVEDPVEYRLGGVNQIQINPKAGLTFATGLRSILRADPDIVMVGEIRDRETAQIAVESALTGHLVLSTLHTNDAPGALTRLIEMGIESFLIASSVDCVLAQRLVRVLCPKCKEAYRPSPEMLKEMGFSAEEDEPVTFFRAKGCSKCNQTGYKGRLGVYEVLRMSESIERMTVERSSADEISRQAIAEGMRTLRQDGLNKVKDGKTSVEEIMRVIV